MSTPKRYSKGVTNVSATDALAMFPTMSPTKVHLFFEDFEMFGQSSALSKHAFPWISTTQGGGSIASVASDGGVISINGTTDTDYQGLETQESFGLEAGKQAWFGARLKAKVTGAQTGVKVGLSDKEGDFVPTRGVFFHSADTASTLTLDIWDTTLVAQSGTLAVHAQAWTVMEWHFDGVSVFDAYINGSLAGSVGTTAFPTGLCTPMIRTVCGAASNTANKYHLDYIYVAKER